MTAFGTRVFQPSEFDRITLPAKNRLDDPQARHTGDIGDDLVELDVHLLQGLLHALDMGPGTLDQIVPLTNVRTKHTDAILTSKPPPKQPIAVKLPKPLAVQNIVLSSRHILDVSRIDQEDLKPTRL